MGAPRQNAGQPDAPMGATPPGTPPPTGRPRIKVIGTDIGAFEREEWVESIVLSPAERYIVHVRFDEPGDYALVNRVQGIDHLGGVFFPETDRLGTVRVVAGTQTFGAPTPARASFDTLRANLPAAREIALYREYFDDPIDHELTLTLETSGIPYIVERLMRFDSAYFHPVEWSGTMPMMNWNSTSEEVRWIVRDPATGAENMDIDWEFEVGDVVKIRLHNERRSFHAMQHPFHIHGQRFLVLARNGVPNENLAWKDTVLLPTGTTTDILLEITNPGSWMAHCHISEHLEAGMRMLFTVK
ncbi:MAG: multicopper oxidase domain-containing protein [Gemmatimonadetes bacterium]|nr:multicopper oxidase domain-containing protein [Gemmatimonadota bacterium]